jgi:glycosyltransferase involved in cell wall biosynthesis
MAAGLPIVATRVGGNVEMVEDEVSGLLVEAEDPEALAKAVLRLMDDPRQVESMGRAARMRVNEYAWDRMVDRYEALYREVASPARLG